MSRRLLGVLAVAVAVGTAVPSASGGTGSPAPEPEPPCPDGAFRAEYFAGTALAGPPVVAACEATVGGNWGRGRAHPRVPEDGFSARWAADLELAAGTYRFALSTDDGTRLFVDGELVIDAWALRPVRTSVAYGALSAGRHRVVVEYFEQDGFAAAQLDWSRSASGWIRGPDEGDRT